MARAAKTATTRRRPRASAAPAAAAADGGNTRPPSPPAGNAPQKKQAVVIVHGMGEQRPLATLREFVEAVYQRDPSLTDGTDARDVDEDADGRPINRIWIVPDDVTGSKELRRITTPVNVKGKRTDFYEFYWADLVTGTPLDMVVAWVRHLLLRSPFRVPPRTQIWIAWIFLWIIAVSVTILGYLIADPTLQPFAGWVRGLIDWLRWAKDWLSPALAIAGLVLLAVRAFTTRPISGIKLGWPLTLLALAVFVALAEQPLLGTERFWAGLLAAAIGAFTAKLLVPYAGDIVRFVRATPDTVAGRAAIRQRGLKLLHDLHNRGLDPVTRLGTREYDRIVLVGHSLGAIVAYDLLQRFWEEAGPSFENGGVPGADVQRALLAVDAFVEEMWKPRTTPYTLELAAFRAAQHDLHQALVVEGQGWLISDFITLGSPIVHSEFLVADSRQELQADLLQRMYSASPPRPDLPNISMQYYDGQGRGPFPHHAAVFAAVRWTNICDEHWFPMLGDVVSGPVPEDFGPGVEDHVIEIRRSALPVLGRFFTHTLYWRNTSGDWTAPSQHIVTLREAVDLLNQTEAPPRGAAPASGDDPEISRG